MNTTDDQLANEIFHNDREPSVLEADLARLSEENESLKDKLGEIKFLWAIVTIVLADFFCLRENAKLGWSCSNRYFSAYICIHIRTNV
jgi:hypothetical protein